MRLEKLKIDIGAMAAAAIASTAGASIVGFVGDTTLEGGWYAFEDEFDVEMTPIIHGGAPYETVISIDVPEFGGSLDFDAGHSLRHIGYGWASWSHGYTGEVFYNNGVYEMGYDLNMNGVGAFDAYIEPNGAGAVHMYEVTAFGSAGGEAQAVCSAYGDAGATHFGFYATGETIVRIEIKGTCDWAMGEWRVGIPTPGVMVLLGVGALCEGRRRR